jgi:glycosyltransferase involved in cell wall biosynthesis
MRRRRRLLTIAHSYVVTMNRRLAHEMARLGGEDWEITAVAPRYFHGSNDLRPVHLDPLADEPCPLIPVDAYLTGRVHLFTYGWQLRSLLAGPWDLVHCWEEPYVAAGGQVAWWTPRSTPLVFYSCQSLNKRYPPPFQWVEEYAVARAAGFVCSGQLVAENLKTRPGYAGLPIVPIPHGTDTNQFRPDPSRAKHIRGSLGWSSGGPPVVGYLGRFVPEKGLALLQRVLDEVRSPWRALFVGTGPLESSLRKWSERHGDRVRICNGVLHDQVPAYLNAMDIMCVPSQTTPAWKEQFGRALIEAFASGVAVIASDSGEIPYVVRDAGLIVGEKDEEGWRQAIGELLAHHEKREELSARGLARASDEFAWPVVARRSLDFFDAIAGGPQRGHRWASAASISL